jgi:hypothetical protein
MSRLTHSHKGFFRSLQISRHDLFIFVEGVSTDPYFYGCLCERCLTGSPVSYVIVRAVELPGATGGKSRLVKMYKALKDRKSLRDTFKDKVTISLFFLDKDVDDFVNTKLRSEHVCYTELYSVENYIFKFGDLVSGTALASSLERREVEAGLGDPSLWRQRIVSDWSDWIKLCLFARKKKIRCECGFGTASKINTMPDGSVDSNELLRCLAILESNFGKGSVGFKRSFEYLANQVDKILAEYDHDKIFNGKWYTHLLAKEISRIAGSKPYEQSGITSRIKSSILSTLDFSAPWTSHFMKYIEHAKSLL